MMTTFLTFDDPVISPRITFDTVTFDVEITETVTVTDPVVKPGPESVMAPPSSMTHLITDDWGWEQVRDFVVNAIYATVGAFPRNPIKEASIFKSFVQRWGDRAAPIARAAVDNYGCWWKNAPISVERFCKASDPYFAAEIAAALT